MQAFTAHAGVRKTLFLGTIMALAAGCASSGSHGAHASRGAHIDRSDPYPARVLAAPSRGATLFSSNGLDAAPVATFNSHVPVLALGPSQEGRVPVQIEGDMPIRGFIPEAELFARVQRSGYIEGTPVFVEANDLVGIVALGDDGVATVRVDPQHLLAFDASHDVLVRAFGPAHRGFVGTYPVVRLGAAPVIEAGRTLPPGAPARIVSRTPLLASIEGAVYDERPLDVGVSCRVLATVGDHAEVLVGIGPYVRGFVPSSAIEPAAETENAAPSEGPTLAHPLVALVTPGEAQGELVHVPAGAVISLPGGQQTELTGPAYARVLARTGDGAEVLVTVTGEVVARGIVPFDALGATATLPAPDSRVATR